MTDFFIDGDGEDCTFTWPGMLVLFCLWFLLCIPKVL